MIFPCLCAAQPGFWRAAPPAQLHRCILLAAATGRKRQECLRHTVPGIDVSLVNLARYDATPGVPVFEFRRYVDWRKAQETRMNHVT